MMALVTLADQCVKRGLLLRASQKLRRSRHRHRPGRDTVTRYLREPILVQATFGATSCDDQLKSVPSIHIRFFNSGSARGVDVAHLDRGDLGDAQASAKAKLKAALYLGPRAASSRRVTSSGLSTTGSLCALGTTARWRTISGLSSVVR
jgi:hypothetical protein